MRLRLLIIMLTVATLTFARPDAAAAAPGELTGSLPAGGGIGLAVWGGGTPQTLADAANSQGCTALAVWVARSNGELVGFVFGAPGVVNTGFLAVYPGSLPASTPVIVICKGPAPAPLPQQTQDVNAQMSRLIVDGLNRERASRGLTALRDAPVLFTASARYAAILLQAGRLDHSLDGEPWDRARAAGYPTMNVGEIIASRTFSGTFNVAGEAGEFVRMWMESAPHRAIVLGESLNATEIGAGCANGRTSSGQTTIYCVGMTGRP
jgi:uncharacterized protein YkwD